MTNVSLFPVHVFKYLPFKFFSVYETKLQEIPLYAHFILRVEYSAVYQLGTTVLINKAHQARQVFFHLNIS